MVEAPTFYPTAAEFHDPMQYIQSIRVRAERFGICCIVPPASWKPPFVLDRNTFKFPTRVQRTNELLVRSAPHVSSARVGTAHFGGLVSFMPGQRSSCVACGCLLASGGASSAA